MCIRDREICDADGRRRVPYGERERPAVQTVEPAAAPKIFLDGQQVVEHALLKDDADCAADSVVLPAERMPRHEDAACARGEQCRQDGKRRGLSRAVGP